MPAKMTLLELDPETQLVFHKGTSASNSPSRILKLRNKSNGHVAYKVKTTAPKSYLVRPSSGVLNPNSSADVQIILQQQTGAETITTAHRFLVQAVTVQSDAAVSREQWNEWQQNQKDTLQEQRLNVDIIEQDAEPALNRPVDNSSVAPSSRDASETTMAAKYDELVKYTLSVEKEKKQLQAELDSKKGKGAVAESAYSLVHLLMAAFFGVLLAMLPKTLGK